MASKNRSSSSAGASAPPENHHDVFISFCDEDTGQTFTSHLNAAFARNGLKTYVGNALERVDDGISASCVKAIEDAKLSVIVFSMNYASSPWCLEELVNILDCSKNKKQKVLPVFYDVGPRTVRRQKRSYAEAFAMHEQNLEGSMEKVQLWRNALTEASTYSGWDCTTDFRTEYEMVEGIAKDVSEKLDRVYVGDLDWQIQKLEQLAQLQEELDLVDSSDNNERNLDATRYRIQRLKAEKKLRMLRLPPHLLSHMELSEDTNSYF